MYRVSLRAALEAGRFPALHAAVIRDDVNEVSRLLGVTRTDVNEVYFGFHPLTLAILFKHTALVKHLLAVPGRSVNSETTSVNSEMPSVNSETRPLNSATPSVNSETRSLNSETPSVNSDTQSVNSGTPSVNSETPSVNSETPRLMCSPLVLAVEMESPEIVELLLQQPDIDVNCEGRLVTPFGTACRLGCTAIVERLLRCDGLETTRTEASTGDTVSHIVCRYGHISVIDVLVRHRIFTLFPGSGTGGLDPVQTACAYNQLKVVQYVFLNLRQIDKRLDLSSARGQNYLKKVLRTASKFGSAAIVDFLTSAPD